jgi:hypothetical protein
MTRTFCFTCAAVASAEVAPDRVWTSASAWGRSGTCCRCRKEKIVMDYELKSTREVQDGEGIKEA